MYISKKVIKDAKPRSQAYWRILFKLLNKEDQLKSNNPLLFELYKFILENIDRSMFITLTFKKGTSMSSLINYTNDFIHHSNKVLHTRDYKKRDNYIEGYAFIEGEIGDHLHVHLLVKYNPKYDVTQHEGIFRASADKVNSRNDNQVFNQNCIDFDDTADNYAKYVGYCMKDLRDWNIDDRLKFIGKEGLC